MEDERDFVELNLEALAFREASGDGKQKSPCPDEELFGAYMEGRLSGEEAEAVAAHMDRCPRCNFAFRLWKEVDKSPAPAVPSPLLEEAKALAKRPFKRFVLRLMERALELLNPEEASLISPDPSPATVPCRGDGSEPVYGAEVMEFDLGLPGFSCLRIQHLEAVDTTGEKARVTVITDRTPPGRSCGDSGGRSRCKRGRAHPRSTQTQGG